MKTYHIKNAANYVNPSVYRDGAFYRLTGTTVRLVSHNTRYGVVEYHGVRVHDVPLSQLFLATDEQVVQILREIRGEAVPETAETEHPVNALDRVLFALYLTIGALFIVAIVKLILLVSFAVLFGIIGALFALFVLLALVGRPL